MRHRIGLFAGAAVLAFTLVPPLYGATDSPTGILSVASVFSDHMVLQRGRAVPVWGRARPGDRVALELKADGGTDSATTTVLTVTDASGKWTAQFGPMPAGGPFQMLIRPTSRHGDPGITLTDILVGDVWLCSGQSNMGFTLDRDRNARQAIDHSSNTQIRLLKIPRSPSAGRLENLKTSAQWQVCGPSSVPTMSAVAYYFGRDIQKHLGVPVGLVISAVGGTSAECWVSREGLRPFPEFEERIARIEREARDPEFARQRYETELAKWNEALRKKSSQQGTSASVVSAASQTTVSDSKRPTPEGPPRRPTVLYNGMIAPLVPMALRGAIWYQGESNVSRSEQYRRLFPALIQDWRNQWKDDTLPFLFVQLPFFHAKKAESGEDTWAELREAQLMTYRNVPATGMAVAVDTGDAKDIHPRDKEPVGQRLALAARAVAYGEKLVWTGPLFTTATIESANMRIRFDHVGTGLASRDKPDRLRGFAIAGSDRKFVWADAQIDSSGNTVIVSSTQVASPVAVRYSWAANPDGNLCNNEGLPASPFRTDDWPGISTGNVKDSVPVAE